MLLPVVDYFKIHLYKTKSSESYCQVKGRIIVVYLSYNHVSQYRGKVAHVLSTLLFGDAAQWLQPPSEKEVLPEEMVPRGFEQILLTSCGKNQG